MVRMDDGAILNVGVAANADPVAVSTENTAIPDRAAGTDLHISDDDSVFSNESIGVNLRKEPPVAANDRHGTSSPAAAPAKTAWEGVGEEVSMPSLVRLLEAFKASKPPGSSPVAIRSLLRLVTRRATRGSAIRSRIDTTPLGGSSRP